MSDGLINPSCVGGQPPLRQPRKRISAELEAQRGEITKKIERLAVAMVGDLEDLPELQDLMKKEGAARDAATGNRGTEGIDFSDCGFAGTLSPLGLLNGLCALNMVAGLATNIICSFGDLRRDPVC